MNFVVMFFTLLGKRRVGSSIHVCFFLGKMRNSGKEGPEIW